VAAGLEEELAGLGEPVGSAAECKAKAVQLIDACSNRLEGEASGSVHTELRVSESCEGEAFELSLTVNDVQAAYSEDKTVTTDTVEIGGFEFQLQVNVRNEEERKSVGTYLNVSVQDKCMISARVGISCTFSATNGDDEIRRLFMEHTYGLDEEEASGGFGYNAFISSRRAEALSGEVTFHASVFVDSIEIKAASVDNSSGVGNTLLCARLADLQDVFTSSMNTLYSNSYFFSVGFRKSLARELQGSRGGIGLPGNIASHVPVGVLRKLRKKLPAPIAEYRSKVLGECTTTTEAVIGKYVGMECHPKLQIVLIQCAEEFSTFKHPSLSITMRRYWNGKKMYAAAITISWIL